MYSEHIPDILRIHYECIPSVCPCGGPRDSTRDPPGTPPHPGGNVDFQSVRSRAKGAENFMPVHVGAPPRVPWRVVRGSALHPSQRWFLGVVLGIIKNHFRMPNQVLRRRVVPGSLLATFPIIVVCIFRHGQWGGYVFQRKKIRK